MGIHHSNQENAEEVLVSDANQVLLAVVWCFGTSFRTNAQPQLTGLTPIWHEPAPALDSEKTLGWNFCQQLMLCEGPAHPRELL